MIAFLGSPSSVCTPAVWRGGSETAISHRCRFLQCSTPVLSFDQLLTPGPVWH